MKSADVAAVTRLCREMITLEKALTKCSSGFIDGGKHSGAFKRRSMDLTRALADLRKPWRDFK